MRMLGCILLFCLHPFIRRPNQIQLLREERWAGHHKAVLQGEVLPLSDIKGSRSEAYKHRREIARYLLAPHRNTEYTKYTEEEDFAQ